MKELLERAANARQLSSRDLHIILDALPLPLSWATLPGGQIQFVNRAFSRTFGYPEGTFSTADDWIERAYPQIQHRQEARRRWRDLWQARSEGISEIGAFEVEVLCADGLRRAVLFTRQRRSWMPSLWSRSQHRPVLRMTRTRSYSGLDTSLSNAVH